MEFEEIYKEAEKVNDKIFKLEKEIAELRIKKRHAEIELNVLEGRVFQKTSGTVKEREYETQQLLLKLPEYQNKKTEYDELERKYHVARANVNHLERRYKLLLQALKYMIEKSKNIEEEYEDDEEIDY